MAYNPSTGDKILANRRNTVLTYGLGIEAQNKVEQMVNDQNFVLDCSDNFTDILALLARILIADPLKMNRENLNLFMNALVILLTNR